MEESWNRMLERVTSWLDAAILGLPNFFVALVIFLISFWLSKSLRKWSSIALRRAIKQASIRNLISSVLSVVIISFGIFLALGVLNLDDVLKSLLAGAGVAGLAIGLALQGTLANTFSGVFLALDDVLNVGDWIETNSYAGNVIDIDLRFTKLKEGDNNIVVIPNKLVLDNPFKNYGLTTRIRTNIKCGVAYDSDLEQVKQIAISTIQKIFPPTNLDSIDFHYLNFGDSAIDFQLRFWVDATAELNATEAKSRAILAIKKAFDKNGINIPFPIRTIIQENK